MPETPFFHSAAPSLLLPEPDAAFRLSATERAKVRPEFDADALERLLAAVVPEVRPMLLRGFQWPEAGQPMSHIVKLGDASLTPLLDEVWAPYWDLLPEKMIDLEDKDFPGTGPRAAENTRSAWSGSAGLSASPPFHTAADPAPCLAGG